MADRGVALTGPLSSLLEQLPPSVREPFLRSLSHPSCLSSLQDLLVSTHDQLVSLLSAEAVDNCLPQSYWHEVALILRQAACRLLVPCGILASALLCHPRSFASLGCPRLDHMLRGGFPSSSLIDLVGEASSGKTQLVIQTILTIQRPKSLGGLGLSAVYIITSGSSFPYRRWCQMCYLLASKWICQMFSSTPKRQAKRFKLTISSENGLGQSSSQPYIDPEDSIASVVAQLHEHLLIATCPTSESLIQLIQFRLRALLRTKPIGIIAIDSIANLDPDGWPFKSRVGQHEDLSNPQQVPDRARQSTLFLTHLARQLLEISQEFNLPIIHLNQVIDDIYEPVIDYHGKDPLDNCAWDLSATRVEKDVMGPRFSPLSFVTSGRSVLPALGLAWANCVNMRVAIERTNRLYTDVINVMEPMMNEKLQELLRNLDNVTRSGLDLGDQHNRSFVNLQEFGQRPHCCHPIAKALSLKRKRKQLSSLVEVESACDRAMIYVRRLKVLFAPHLPESITEFFVDSFGVHGMPLSQNNE